MTEARLSTKDLILILVIWALSWFLANVVMSFIFPGSSVPMSLPSILAGITWISVLLGFMIYSQRLRDERTIQISYKSARNGFAFIFCVVPAAIVALSATDVSTDVSLALLMVWIGAVSLAGFSSLYYYRK
nr:MAG: hypothetical protein AM324_10725 [Candidatus Thorarchaeota archaeon SMTZ1-83]